MTTKKKWAIGVGVFLAFGLLGAILDDEKSSTSGENKAGSQQSEQTEQKQETKAEPQQSEQTEQKQETEAEREAKEKAEKKKDLLEHARYWANSFSSTQGPSCSRSYRDGKCKERFLDKIPNPTTDEDFELYREFKKVWDEEWDKVQTAKQRMDNM